MNQKYQHWLNHENLDPELKKELLSMDETQINDAFYTNVEFGTAGMRGLLGPGCNRLNIYTIRKANVAFAEYICSVSKKAMQQGVAIAYDNRYMSKEFALESARVLAMYNIKAYVFESLRPTPELSFAVRHLKCFGGIVITASHNPKEYNGYKLYDEHGCQLVPSIVQKVIDGVNKIEDELAIEVTLTSDQALLIEEIAENIDKAYYEEVLNIQMRNQDKSNLRIVFTPQHGTANIPVREVLTKAGYHLICVEPQCSPDPAFSNTVTPNPEDKAAYTLAIEYAKKHQAHIVLACDPDADRVGVVVKHEDDYILMTGNQTGSVLLSYLFETRKQQNITDVHPVIFNTVVTSDLGEKIASSYCVETEKTLTGFKFIGEKIAKYEVNNEKQFVFGYEESYGYLIKPFVRDKDAIQACLFIAEAANYYLSIGKTLWDVLNDLYKQHGYYLESQTSLTLKGQQGQNQIKEIIKSFIESNIQEIASYKVVKFENFKDSVVVENNKVSELDFPKSDVLKFYLEEGSWVAVRPSGTEPKCKFYYCIVGTSTQDTKEKTEKIQKSIDEMVGKILG